MRPLLIVVVILVVVLHAPAATAHLTALAGAMPSACDGTAGFSGSDDQLKPIASPAAELPPGIDLTILADQAVERWPPHASGLILTLRHLALDPGVASESRRAAGPLLFYVETGSVGISINSRMTSFDSGEGVLVQTGQRYVLRNLSAAPASLIRVQVVPPGEETKVAFGEPVQVHVEDRASPPGPPFIDSQLLLTGEIPAIEEPMHLVLGCLSWADPTADSADIVNTGPIGYVVVHGQMLVGEMGRRNPGDCVMFQAHVPHRLRAGEASPIALVVAAMPDGRQLWGTASGSDSSPLSTNRLRFACGEQAETNVDSGSASVSDADP